MVYTMKIAARPRAGPLYEAVIEATEEAILNALCMARDLDGASGHVVRALPLEDVKASSSTGSPARAPSPPSRPAGPPASPRRAPADPGVGGEADRGARGRGHAQTCTACDPRGRDPHRAGGRAERLPGCEGRQLSSRGGRRSPGRPHPADG